MNNFSECPNGILNGLTLLSGELYQLTGTSLIEKFNRRAIASISISKPKPFIRIRLNISLAASC